MRSSIIKFIIGTLLGIAVALLVSFNALLLWVATGPRSLDVFSQYIEAALEPADHSYSVSIGETWLIWDGWKHPIDISLRDVSVLTKEKQRFSKFPEISLGLDLLALAGGHLLPTSLTITHPVLSLFQNDDRSISFGFRKEADETAVPAAEPAAAEEVDVPFATLLAPLISPDENSNLRKLRMVSIVNADVSVGNTHKGVFFNATGVEMSFKSNRHGIQAFVSAKISYDNYQSLIAAQLSLEKGGSTLEGNVSVSQLMPGTLAELFAGNTVLSAMKLPVSGKGRIALDTNGTLQRLNFVVDGGKGTIETDKLDGILPVNALHAEGQIGNNGSDIEITKLAANLDNMLLEADGVASLSNNDAAIRANVFLKHVPSANVHMLWPPSLAPQTREWMTKNISEGIIPQAESHINIALGDLKKPVLPKEDVDSTIMISGAKIRYLPEHPLLTNINGRIHIDGLSLNATIDSGQYMKDSKMSGGTLAIDDLNDDNPYIKVGFDVDTSAKDVVRFLGLPRLKHAQRLNLNEETVEGSVKGHASVGFRFFAPRDEKGKPSEADVDFDVKAEVKGMAQPDFMHKFDIKNADGKFTANNDALEFKGSGDVNGAHATESDVQYLFKPKDGFDTLIAATATAPMEALPRFGYPAFSFIKGTIGVKADMKVGNSAEVSQGVIDLTDTAITLPGAKLTKPDKEPASLDISAEKKDDVETISSFHYTGKDTDVHGSAGINKELTEVEHVSVDKLVFGNTNLDQVIYDRIDGGFKVDAHGKVADLSPWMDSGDESTFSFEHFPSAEVNLDIGQAMFGKSRALAAVKGTLDCDIHICSSANISGKTVDGKPFSFRILRNPKGSRQLSLHAQSAGAFLKAIDMFDSMDGGDLTVTGSYDDHTEHSVLTGKADITEHTIKDAPVLAKILSLASFTGFFDTLQGKGIYFSRLRAPFTLSNDVLTINEAKTHGDALGMTIEGTVTFPKRTLDLQGTIVPSYTLNNVVGKVPLVGNMLTGGEGQGVFAARYSVKGSDKAPDVSVNPLSILTPGFLRGLFDVFDKPKKSSDDSDSDSDK